jgi:hypothetical protein
MATPLCELLRRVVLYHGELDVTAELLARDCAFLFRERVRTR